MPMPDGSAERGTVPWEDWAAVSFQLAMIQKNVREAYEAWAGSELPEEPKAETAPEAYAYRIIKEMLEPIKEALAMGNE